MVANASNRPKHHHRRRRRRHHRITSMRLRLRRLLPPLVMGEVTTSLTASASSEAVASLLGNIPTISSYFLYALSPLPPLTQLSHLLTPLPYPNY